MKWFPCKFSLLKDKACSVEKSTRNTLFEGYSCGVKPDILRPKGWEAQGRSLGKKGCLMMIDQHKVVNNYKWSKIYNFVYFLFFFLETLWITLCMIRAVTCLVLVFTFLLIRPELILCKTNFHCSYSCKSLGDMSLSESNFCSLFCAK